MRINGIHILLIAIIVLLYGEDGVYCKAQNVIIVGAGVSGLAAASRLVQKHGFLPSQITILEAENRIGGRINTVEYESGVIEIGAQFCHGTNNIVYKLAEPAGLLHTELPPSLESTGWASNVQPIYPKTGRTLTQDDWVQYRDVVDQIYSSAITADSKNIPSLGAYFNQEYPKYLSKGALLPLDDATAMDLLNWEDRAQGIETPAPNWLGISLLGYASYKTSKGNDDLTWKKGYSTLLPVLTKNVDIDSMVKLNSKVKKIYWNPDLNPNNQVQVQTDNGFYQADVVLVTVSLGVLKKDADTIFQPYLPPAKTNAIKYLGWGTVGKIFLKFENPWWTIETWGGVNFLTKPADRTNTWKSRLLGFYPLRDQPNLLIGWVSGSDTSFETIPEKALVSICSEMLKGAIGKQFASTYTPPIGVIRSSWTGNPNFRGTYSYRSVASDTFNVSPNDLLRPELDSSGDYYRLLFSGEATNSNYYSTVHAAIDTGYKQADRIASYSYDYTTNNN